MTYNYKNLDNRRKAKFMLEKLLPQAREEVNAASKAQSVSAVGQSVFQHMRISAVTGVHIYQGQKGGWFADLTFEGLPPGVPSIIGTPSASPNGTREEAVQEAIGLLTTVMAAERDRPTSDEAPFAVFHFDKIALRVPSQMIHELETSGVEKLGVPYVVRRLEEIREKMNGGEPFTAELFDNLSEQDQLQVAAIAALAIAEGFVRWPMTEEAAPVQHTHH